MVQRFLLALILALPQLLATDVFAHGLQPSRLEAPSGSKLVAYRFTATNHYNFTDHYAVQCFKNDLNHPYDCKSAPQSFYVAPKKSRTFKTQIQPDEDGVYLVCTIQTTESVLVTRVCARFGIGVSADSNREHKPAKHTSVSAGSR